ncbi:MAG: transcription termination/antitermination protein NusA [Clostridia bacterium]|nr:transcription termination/antitermination protein NusA [Clostridia bacterium]MBR5902691.1 transcription termination/antitermination protein NusA [Clostridia bacterium]
MASEIIGALEALEKEKGIKKEYMLDRISQALVAAYKALYKRDTTAAIENVFVNIDEKSGAISMVAVKTIVEEVENPAVEISLMDAEKYSKTPALGDQVRVPVNMKDFGRIATQTAKQVIIQGIREAERTMIAEEFASKEQEIITALVTKVDPRYGSVIVELGGKREHTEAMLPAQEQIAGEVISEGDRIKVFVVEVKAAGKGPQIMLSRTHAGLVKKLFELEVPEIASGIVSITHIAREAGSRTKIAVASQNPDVDPIGACVGPKGGRVAAVVNELKGEKIDIIKYSEDPVQFVAEALSPSDVISVQMLEDNKSCIVVVPDNQLSLAIGKEGQNARLAAKLTGFKIDIKPESAAN